MSNDFALCNATPHTHRYWIVVASKDQVEKGTYSNFMQACHGKAALLQRLKIDDWVIYYSSKLEFGSEKKVKRS
jgi:EVE domain